MECNNCKHTAVIPAWVHELTIGSIADKETNVFVTFRDITQGRRTVYPATSALDGIVKLNLSDIMFPENHSYEISISRDMAGADAVEFNIDGQSLTCVGARFEKLRSESGDIETILTYTIEMQ